MIRYDGAIGAFGRTWVEGNLYSLIVDKMAPWENFKIYFMSNRSKIYFELEGNHIARKGIRRKIIN